MGQQDWVQGGLSLASCPPGAGVLVTTVVAGGIAILRPFTAASRPFLRDIIFYMVAVFLTFVALYLGRVTLPWALGEQPRARAGSSQAWWVGGPGAQERVAGRAQSLGSFGSKGKKPYASQLEQRKGPHGPNNQRGQGRARVMSEFS